MLRPGLEWEEATIFYGDEYDRKDYEKGYWAQKPPLKGRPSAKNMTLMIRKYCAEYDVDYVLLARKYGA